MVFAFHTSQQIVSKLKLKQDTKNGEFLQVVARSLLNS